MWIKFCTSLLLSRLIHRVKCIDTPYSDMYLPHGTNGFICGTELFSIEYARQVTSTVMELFFYGKYFQKYPKLFEDTHLFNMKSDILLSWPERLRLNQGLGNAGKFRLIINIRGQIIGMVIIDIKHHNNHISFEKCKPVRSSFSQGNVESNPLDESWSEACDNYGFNCDSKYFPLSMIKSGNGLDSPYYFQTALDVKGRFKNFEKYIGGQFIGDDLRLYPLHHSSSSALGSGAQGFFRVVFDKKNREFKGITNARNMETKCVPVWDLSSASSDTIYSPSSVFNTERIYDKDWPETCFGQRFKYKTIWLFIEFALKEWSTNESGKKLNFPIVKGNKFRFWPVRRPETHDNSSAYAFAIGHDTNLNTYGLYRAVVRDGVLRRFKICLNLPHEDIRILQEKLGTSL
ncbi:BgtE-40004 [Blumeria graminis f. sp. tritici]|uniref:BgtE-40004 n=1 Tax=Blumeria graminis f. sp. tritici TaxID=62690 RepID=A0A9X9MH46_BLUGR|nr:BgtE-40004 [Blumeria graminis f. sp. tritici]